MYQLEAPQYFYSLAALIVVLLVFLWSQYWKKIRQKQFAHPMALESLSPTRSVFKPILKLIVFLLALLFLVFGLVNPKIGTQLETVKREGVDIVFAVDVSKSMLAEDVAPSRLEKAKRIVSELTNQLVSDRVGIIAYAATAIPQLPITTDYGAAKMFLQALNTDMLSSQGTAIGEAVALASTFFDDANQTNRVLCIVSDGEDHESGAIEVAKKADEAGITIVSIGVGTEKGAPIPEKRRGVTDRYKKDQNGEVVITRFNKEVLSALAEQTSGLFLEGNNTQETVEAVVELLKKMDKQEFEAKQFVSYKDQFQWALAISLFLVCLDSLFWERKTSWIQRLNLFEDRMNKKNGVR